MMRNAVQERTIRMEKWDDKDQSYEGEFLGVSFHGQGTYRWNKTDVYEGGFFSNQKEGYAVLSFSNNSSFEGLFIKNRPFGPGILTHSNGRQDVGFWVGHKLVRLSRPVDFIVPRLAPTSVAKIKLLQFRRLITLNEKNNSLESDILKKCGCSLTHQSLPYSNLVYDPRSVFFNHPAFDKIFFTNDHNLLEGRFPNQSEDFPGSKTFDYGNKEGREGSSQSSPNANCPCPGVFGDDEDSFDVCSESETSTNDQLGLLGHYTKYGTLEDGEARGNAEIDFDGEEEEEDEETESPMQIVSWNRSELFTEMLKQIFRHRTFEEKLNFEIAKLMLGVRTEFRKTGEKEKECLEFLKMCSLGPAIAVKELLCQHELSEELMDSRGNTSLMFAAATDQHEIIDLLLDYGVDVNAFNDEGVTPLNLCLLRRLAQTHKICNWETGFLPAENQTITEKDNRTEVWKDEESIESLDRIFGDGMSAESKPGIGQMSKPEGDANEMDEEGDTKTSESGQQTTTMKAQFVSKSIRRDEFEQSTRCSAHDRYLFDLSSEPQTIVADDKKDASRSKKAKISRGMDNIEEEEEEGECEKEVDLALADKLTEIDKTIEILLSRGADPNISEVPKPSIQLGVFTKDLNVVNTLLRYGADPDCQMHPNEGLLTSLHVIALLKSAPENVEMCQILLNRGANLEKETSPDFCIYEAEKGFLDDVQGRTPLQVLCMRPDLEYADPKGYVIQIALMLAKYSDKKHFYKGHSSLTLAMLTGNIKLLAAFLKSNSYDPNQTLGNDLGTALHVLVSTEFQKKTIFENSIKMCDLLLSAKADPLKEYKTPSKLIGTCVDYGYREIDEEKATRKANGFDKKETKSGKQGKDGVRDHLKDHIKVVEYLKEKASELKKASTTPDASHLEKSKVERGKTKKEDDANDFGQKGGSRRKEEENADKKIDETGILATGKDENEIQSVNRKGNPRISEKEIDRIGKQRRENEETRNQGQKSEPNSFNLEGNSKRQKEFKTSDQEGKQQDDYNNPKERESKRKTKSESYDEKESSGVPIQEDKSKGIGKRQKEKKPEREAREKQDGGKNFDSRLGDGPKKGHTGNNAKKTVNDKMAEDKDGQQQIKSKLDKHTGKSQKNSKSEIVRDVKREPSLESRKRMLRVFKSFSPPKYSSLTRERFPETLRQSMLQVFGNCVTIDVNQLLLPYVVLRNGDLYYMFEERRPQKTEQYSLI